MSFSSFPLAPDSERRPLHRRNPLLDQRLSELEALLGPAERTLVQDLVTPRMPVLFLVGNPRCGSTAFMQFLQASGAFAVPTNVMARFFFAPILGAKIQQLLFDPAFDFRGEVGALPGERDAESSLGKTKGPLGVNEMLGFWRRFLPNSDFRFIPPEQQERIDTNGISAELAGIEQVFGRPLALKGMLLFNLVHLRRCAAVPLLVHLDRDPIDVACSILAVREEFFLRREDWWSVKPPEYDWLRTMDVHHQVAGQVFFTNRSLAAGLAEVPAAGKLTVGYREFCEGPAGVHARLVGKFRALGFDLATEYRGPAGFRPRTRKQVAPADVDALRVAYDDFASGRLCAPVCAPD